MCIKEEGERPKLIKLEMKGGYYNKYQRTMKEHFENLYSNKQENLEEMDICRCI
jgi:hypothetical protein